IGHYLSMDALAAAVDARTRLVLVSQVSFLTGQRLDLARCAELCRSRGAWLAVDATHAFGVVPVPASVCDFVVSSCYKWLLATHGVGIFTYDPARVGELAPATLGWHSVAHRGGSTDPLAMPLRADGARLAAGDPELLPVFVLDNALARTEGLSPAAIEAHARDLGTALIAGLTARGRKDVKPEAPAERGRHRCFLVDGRVGGG